MQTSTPKFSEKHYSMKNKCTIKIYILLYLIRKRTKKCAVHDNRLHMEKFNICRLTFLETAEL